MPWTAFKRGYERSLGNEIRRITCKHDRVIMILKIYSAGINWVLDILVCELTFRAIISPLGLCKTLVTTPPFPAPNSANLSKSSAFSSPIFLFSARNASSLSRCKVSSSSSSIFFRISSTFCEPIPAASSLLENKE